MRANTSSRRPRVAAQLALVALLAFGSVVEAGRPAVPCDAVRVFPGAALNVLVLPYRYLEAPRVDEELLASTGRDLSALLQIDILHSLLKYRSVGTVQLIEAGESAECEPRLILERILGEDSPGGAADFGSGGQVRPGGGVILLWGRVFVREEDFYLQSYIRFLRRGHEETIGLELPGGGVLEGRLSLTAFSFAPRRVTREELVRLRGAAPEASRLRREASLGSPVVHELAPESPYVVIDAEGAWMRVRVLDSGATGWIQARSDDEAADLRHSMPELAFLDGVAGYLRFRAGESEDVEHAPPRTPITAWQRFSWYSEHADRIADAEALAVGEALSGFLDILAANGAEARLRAAFEAAPRFARARQLVPQDADLRNLEALSVAAGLAIGAVSPGETPRIVGTFLDALALDPRNPMVVANLETVYAMLAPMEPGASPYEPEELGRRLEAVRRVRAYLEGDH